MDDPPSGGFQVENVSLPAPRPGSPAGPLRFAQLSDIHVRTHQPRHDRLVRVVNEWDPDFVFVTGDIIGRSRGAWEVSCEVLAGLRARYGVYACRGNWEARCPLRRSTQRRRLAGCGVELLVNEVRTVETDAGRVRICGIDDLAEGWPDFGASLGDGEGADYTIMLSHAPLAAAMLDGSAGVDLVLGGHTHGGQIRVPLLWHAILPICTGGYISGLYRTAWGHVYVNRGFGESAWLPMRFRCPAEVTLFEVGGGAG